MIIGLNRKERDGRRFKCLRKKEKQKVYKIAYKQKMREREREREFRDMRNKLKIETY